MIHDNIFCFNSAIFKIYPSLLDNVINLQFLKLECMQCYRSMILLLKHIFAFLDILIPINKFVHKNLLFSYFRRMYILLHHTKITFLLLFLDLGIFSPKETITFLLLKWVTFENNFY